MTHHFHSLALEPIRKPPAGYERLQARLAALRCIAVAHATTVYSATLREPSVTRALRGTLSLALTFHTGFSDRLLRAAGIVCILGLITGSTAMGQDCDVEGSWEVFSLRFTDPDGTVRDIEIGDPPGLKILSATHWVFVELTGDEASPTSGGGGTYTVEGNTYTETVEYHAATDFIGQEIPFECRVEGDRWYQSGTLPNGVKLEEVYRRAE